MDTNSQRHCPKCDQTKPETDWMPSHQRGRYRTEKRPCADCLRSKSRKRWHEVAKGADKAYEKTGDRRFHSCKHCGKRQEYKKGEKQPPDRCRDCTEALRQREDAARLQREKRDREERQRREDARQELRDAWEGNEWCVNRRESRQIPSQDDSMGNDWLRTTATRVAFMRERRKYKEHRKDRSNKPATGKWDSENWNRSRSTAKNRERRARRNQNEWCRTSESKLSNRRKKVRNGHGRKYRRPSFDA